MSENELCQECREAEEKAKLDINCVLGKLKSKKGRELSDLEARYLCLYLRGCSWYEIAFRIYRYKIPMLEEIQKQDKEIQRQAANLRSEMSDKVNLYIKESMGVNAGNRIPSLQKVVDFFRDECKPISNHPQPEKFFMLVKGKKSKSEIIDALKRIGVDVETIMRIESEE